MFQKLAITFMAVFSMNTKEATPSYLYKILSVDRWVESQSKSALVLSPDDDPFIHLSRDDQLERIKSKYWANVPEYVLLKLDVSKLGGKLVYEANPGGTQKYYHLYEGAIPRESVVSSELVKVSAK